jgi:hypothetical protein
MRVTCWKTKTTDTHSEYVPPPTTQEIPARQGLPLIETSLAHFDTKYSVGLLWTSCQADAEISTWQHILSQETDIHAPGGIRTYNPSKRAAFDRATPGLNQNMWYLLIFHFSNGYGNAPQCYFIRTLSVLFARYVSQYKAIYKTQCTLSIINMTSVSPVSVHQVDLAIPIEGGLVTIHPIHSQMSCFALSTTVTCLQPLATNLHPYI